MQQTVHSMQRNPSSKETKKKIKCVQFIATQYKTSFKAETTTFSFNVKLGFFQQGQMEDQ